MNTYISLVRVIYYVFVNVFNLDIHHRLNKFTKCVFRSSTNERTKL